MKVEKPEEAKVALKELRGGDCCTMEIGYVWLAPDQTQSLMLAKLDDSETFLIRLSDGLIQKFHKHVLVTPLKMKVVPDRD